MKKNPDILHKHMIVRSEILYPVRNVDEINKWLIDLVKKLNMNILMGPYSIYCNKEGNKGITGFVIIETSHIVIHIWDELDIPIAQLDVYTCGELSEKDVFDHIQYLKPKKIEWKYLDRITNLNVVSRGLIEIEF